LVVVFLVDLLFAVDGPLENPMPWQGLQLKRTFTGALEDFDAELNAVLAAA
jgi:hypothetical protein